MTDQPLCSGFGQWHSPNNPTNPRPYVTTSLGLISAMAMTPPRSAKSRAQWCIFSSLLSRVHADQREKGFFCALWCDIDETQALGFFETLSRSAGVVPDFIAYTTAGATAAAQKCRIIVPLAEPIPGETFVLCQKILNDKLVAAGLAPDRVAERAGQVCYLPNRGEFYQYQIDHDLGPLSVMNDWSAEIRIERQRKLEADRRLLEHRQQARLKASERMAAGCVSPIQAFNEAYGLELVLESYGYARSGNRYLSPQSESGVPGVVVRNGKWFSSHASDADMGRKTSTGTMGDAFDLYVRFSHGGDRNAAIRAAGAMFQAGGVSLTRLNQQRYMEAINE